MPCEAAPILIRMHHHLETFTVLEDLSVRSQQLLHVEHLESVVSLSPSVTDSMGVLGCMGSNFHSGASRSIILKWGQVCCSVQTVGSIAEPWLDMGPIYIAQALQCIHCYVAQTECDVVRVVP
jgi:hypothetical protein